MPTLEGNNNWITLETLKNGVQVQRKFAGLHTDVNENDVVERCEVYYWYRELYPNNAVIKTEKRWYVLEDLAYTTVTENGLLYEMQPLAVLSGFIAMLGLEGIVNPARDTLGNDVILPIDAANGYPLRRDTREKTLIEQ
jgi:hypothetical protein